MKIKKTIIYPVIGLITIIIILAVLPFVINLDNYISKITVPASKAIGRQVTIKHIRLSILTGLGLELKDVSIADVTSSTVPFVHVDDVKVGVDILPLFKKEISINSIKLLDPNVHLIRYPDGKYNFSDLLKKKTAEKTKASASKPSSIPEGFYLGKLLLDNGTITLTSHENNKVKKYIVKDINLGISNFNVKNPFSIYLTANLGTLKDTGFEIKGMIGPIGQYVSAEKLPYDLTAKFNHIDIPYILKFAGFKKEILKSGIVDADETLKSTPRGTVDITGKVSLSGIAFTDADIKPFDITNNLEFTTAQKSLKINDIALQSDGINIDAKGNVNLNKHVSIVHLESKKLVLNNLIAFYSTLKQKLPQELLLSGNGSIKTDVSTTPGSTDINGVVDFTDAKVAYDKKFIKQSSTPFQLTYHILKQGSRFDLKDVDLVLDKLNVLLTGNVLTTGNMGADISVKTNRINLASLENILPMLKTYNAHGSLSLTTRAKGELKKPKELNINGDIKVNDVSAQIASIPRPLKSLNMDAAFTKHSLLLKSLLLVIGQSIIKANGSISDFSAPKGRINIVSPYLNIDELTPKTKPSHKQASEEITSRASNKPSIIDKADIMVDARVDKGIVKKAQFKSLYALIQLTKAVLFIKQFHVNAFSGIISANGSMGLRHEQPYDLKLNVAKLELGQLLNTFTSYGDVLSGKLASDLALNGDIKDLKHTVSGNGIITVTDGEIKTFSALSELLKVASLSTIGKGQTTRFNNIKLTAVINHGKVTTNDLKLLSNEMDITSNGYFDLDGNLNFHGNSILSRALSNGIGGTIGQVIKNEQGRVEIPFLLTGTIRKPVFALDRQAYSQRLKELAKKQVIKELNKQINKELKGNENKQIQQLQQKGSKAIEQLFK